MAIEYIKQLYEFFFVSVVLIFRINIPSVLSKSRLLSLLHQKRNDCFCWNDFCHLIGCRCLTTFWREVKYIQSQVPLWFPITNPVINLSNQSGTWLWIYLTSRQKVVRQRQPIKWQKSFQQKQSFLFWCKRESNLDFDRTEGIFILNIRTTLTKKNS